MAAVTLMRGMPRAEVASRQNVVPFGIPKPGIPAAKHALAHAAALGIDTFRHPLGRWDFSWTPGPLP